MAARSAGCRLAQTRSARNACDEPGGDHSPKNLPLLVAGGHQLGLKLGRHIKHDPDKHPPMANVLLGVVQKMGVQSAKFADATGPLTGLV